jgi:hypothetical protein
LFNFSLKESFLKRIYWKIISLFVLFTFILGAIFIYENQQIQGEFLAYVLSLIAKKNDIQLNFISPTAKFPLFFQCQKVLIKNSVVDIKIDEFFVKTIFNSLNIFDLKIDLSMNSLLINKINKINKKKENKKLKKTINVLNPILKYKKYLNVLDLKNIRYDTFKVNLLYQNNKLSLLSSEKTKSFSAFITLKESQKQAVYEASFRDLKNQLHIKTQGTVLFNDLKVSNFETNQLIAVYQKSLESLTFEFQKYKGNLIKKNQFFHLKVFDERHNKTYLFDSLFKLIFSKNNLYLDISKAKLFFFDQVFDFKGVTVLNFNHFDFSKADFSTFNLNIFLNSNMSGTIESNILFFKNQKLSFELLSNGYFNDLTSSILIKEQKNLKVTIKTHKKNHIFHTNFQVDFSQKKDSLFFEAIFDLKKKDLLQLKGQGQSPELQWMGIRARDLCLIFNEKSGSLTAKKFSLYDANFKDLNLIIQKSKNLFYFKLFQFKNKKKQNFINGSGFINKNLLNIQSFQTGGHRNSLKLQSPFIFDFQKQKIYNFHISVNKGFLDFKDSFLTGRIPLSFISFFKKKLNIGGTVFLKAKFKANFLHAHLETPDFIFYKLTPSAKKLAIALDFLSEGTKSKWSGSIKGSGEQKIFRINGTTHKDKISAQLNGDLSLGQLPLSFGNEIKGTLKIHAALEGTFSNPSVTGKMTLENGGFEDFEYGTLLRNIKASITFHDSKGILDFFKADDLSGQGKAEAAGSTFSFKDGINLKLSLSNFQVVEMRGFDLFATGILSLKGPFTNFKTSGSVVINHGTLNLDNFVDQKIQTLKIINPISFKRKEKNNLFPIDLNLKIKDKIEIDGFGVTSFWNGSLSVQGSLLDSHLIGKIFLKKGKISIFGTLLALTKGEIRYDKEAINDPYLELKASKDIEGMDLEISEGPSPKNKTKAIVSLKGRSSNPEVHFFSNPPLLSEDKVLSYLLFGKSTQGITATESLRLAQAFAAFKGIKGIDFVQTIQTILNLDSLSLIEKENFDAKGQTFLSAAKKIKKVKIILNKELSGNDTQIIIEYPISPLWKVETSVSTEAQANVGLFFEKRY